MKLKLTLLIIILGLLQTISAQAKTHLTNMRHWTAPDHTRLVFDVDSLPSYKLSSEGDSQHLIIELSNVENALSDSQIKISDGLIDTVRIKSKDENTLGIIIDLTTPGTIEVFALKKFQDKPERLVIDIAKSIESILKEEAAIKAPPESQHIVFIDPGHGGEDPGAIGRRLKLEEKKVVLSIAQRLHSLLGKEGITSYLSRTGDYYLPLGKRTQLAEQYKADVMISIHANASPNTQARGSSVYYLSPKGASDKASALLAQQENSADLIGGVSLTQNKTVNAILIDMMQTTSVNDSIKLGDIALKHLEAEPSEKLRSAPFAVLKAPSVPSILVEVAFLSNPKDELALANPGFQQKTAEQLARTVREYLNETPALPHKEIAETEKQVHIVKKGETIWRIAKLYGTNAQKLRQINKMGNFSVLKVGQKLYLP